MKMIRKLNRIFQRTISSKSQRNYLNMLSKIQLQGLLNHYIPYSDSALMPNGIVKILNDTIYNKRKMVLEFGSGISTIYIAKILSINGGKLFSIDHNKDWIEIMRNSLINEKIESHVEFVYAPLQKSELSVNDLEWYCISSLSHLENRVFDLILVDGPPAYYNKISLSRYPALPYLINNNMLSDNFSFYLDDIHRKGERKIIEKWEKKYNINFYLDFDNSGCAISNGVDSYNL